jgi:hypothetical protein
MLNSLPQKSCQDSCQDFARIAYFFVAKVARLLQDL